MYNIMHFIKRCCILYNLIDLHYNQHFILLSMTINIGNAHCILLLILGLCSLKKQGVS